MKIELQRSTIVFYTFTKKFTCTFLYLMDNTTFPDMGGGAESFVFTRYLLLDETVWISIVDLMMPSEAELSVTDAVGCLVMDPL